MSSDIASSRGFHAKSDPELSLTDRERQVLALIARGYANKEIANELAISPRTVECHRFNLRQKAGGRQGRKELFLLNERVVAVRGEACPA